MFARQPISRRDDLSPLAGAFVAQRLSSVHPRVVAWLGEERVAAAVDAEVAEALGACFDLERAARGRRMCPVAGLSDHDYCARFLAAPDGRQVIVELRFKAMRVDL